LLFSSGICTMRHHFLISHCTLWDMSWSTRPASIWTSSLRETISHRSGIASPGSYLGICWYGPLLSQLTSSLSFHNAIHSIQSPWATKYSIASSSQFHFIGLDVGTVPTHPVRGCSPNIHNWHIHIIHKLVHILKSSILRILVNL